MIWFSYHFLIHYWTPFLNALHCLQFWIRQGTIDDIGPFLFSVHIYCPCVPFRFLALNSFYILETLKYMYPIQNTPLISESLYPLLQKQTIMCVISIQVLSWTYRICQPVKGEGTWDIPQDVRHLSLDYSYSSLQMQCSQIVSQRAHWISYRLTPGVNDKSVGYAHSPTPPSFGVSICISAYFHPITSFTWKIKKKEIKAKTEKKKDWKHRWGTQTKSFE